MFKLLRNESPFGVVRPAALQKREREPHHSRQPKCGALRTTTSMATAPKNYLFTDFKRISKPLRFQIVKPWSFANQLS